MQVVTDTSLLRLTGTLAVLKKAAERDQIDLPTALAALQATDFYVRQELLIPLLSLWDTQSSNR